MRYWWYSLMPTMPPSTTQRSNIYIDTGGSVIDAGIVDRTIAALGIDRVLFATDMSFEEGVGKVLDTELTDRDRAKVFAGNFKAILERRNI